jgi:hypothetical protein
VRLKDCRNCGTNEWYAREVVVARLLPFGWTLRQPIYPKFEIRVCGGCGLIDWFVPKKLLDKVKREYERVTEA